MPNSQAKALRFGLSYPGDTVPDLMVDINIRTGPEKKPRGMRIYRTSAKPPACMEVGESDAMDSEAQVCENYTRHILAIAQEAINARKEAETEPKATSYRICLTMWVADVDDTQLVRCIFKSHAVPHDVSQETNHMETEIMRLKSRVHLRLCRKPAEHDGRHTPVDNSTTCVLYPHG